MCQVRSNWIIRRINHDYLRLPFGWSLMILRGPKRRVTEKLRHLKLNPAIFPGIRVITVLVGPLIGGYLPNLALNRYEQNRLLAPAL